MAPANPRVDGEARERMIDIGNLGIWFWHDAMTIEESVAFAQRVEACGYGALWIPEAVGRDPFSHLAYLASKTSSLVLATGIANIWARDAMAMAAAQKTLAELSANRFLLGLGVSHAPLVEGLRGHRYHRPLSAMREYLEKMALARYEAPAPRERPPVVLAALREKMLTLAHAMADGAHPYLVPPSHTRRARGILGEQKLLAPAQAVILEADPARARARARAYLKTYIPRLPNYKNNLLELGYAEADFTDGCSNRLVDDLVAWGTLSTIKARIQAHYDAGADHVCLLPLSREPHRPDMAALEALAPAGPRPDGKKPRTRSPR